MILLVETNPVLRKKLCDMLSRERIIGVATKQQVLEALVQHRNKLNVFIANAALLNEVLSGETITKLCSKLSITVPPIVALYHPDQSDTIKRISYGNYRFEFVRFDEKDIEFPKKYTGAIRAVYPDIHIDIERAKQVWLRTDAKQDLIDVRNWLHEWGFGEASTSHTVHNRKDADDPEDYKALYIELKAKYDQLVAEFEELKKLLELE